MSTQTATRKIVTPGAPDAPVQAAEPDFPSPPKADQPMTMEHRVAGLESKVEFLLTTVRQMAKDVKALHPIGDAAVKAEKEVLPFKQAVEKARATGKFVLSEQGYVGPQS
jgi:hypothetical protein